MQTTTRKGLSEPEVTDSQSINYTVGPAGRTIVTSGKVRDVIRSHAILLDTIVEYNQDEAITGRYDFQSPFITEKGLGQLFQNNTGAQRVACDVVIIDPANDSGVVLPNANGVSAGRVGVVAETINTAAVGRVVFNGFVRIKVAAGIVRNQYLATQNGSVVAAGSTNQGTGTFALAVTNQDVNNTVLALLHPGSSLEGGGIVTGNLQVNGGLGVNIVTNNAGLSVGGAISASGSIALGINNSPQLTAVANNDTLTALAVSPTFNDAGHTGVTHQGIVMTASCQVMNMVDTRVASGTTFLVQLWNNSPTSSGIIVHEIRRTGTEAPAITYRLAGTTYGVNNGYDIELRAGNAGFLDIVGFNHAIPHITLDSINTRMGIFNLNPLYPVDIVGLVAITGTSLTMLPPGGGSAAQEVGGSINLVNAGAVIAWRNGANTGSNWIATNIADQLVINGFVSGGSVAGSADSIVVRYNGTQRLIPLY